MVRTTGRVMNRHKLLEMDFCINITASRFSKFTRSSLFSAKTNIVYVPVV